MASTLHSIYYYLTGNVSKYYKKQKIMKIDKDSGHNIFERDDDAKTFLDQFLVDNIVDDNSEYRDNPASLELYNDIIYHYKTDKKNQVLYIANKDREKRFKQFLDKDDSNRRRFEQNVSDLVENSLAKQKYPKKIPSIEEIYSQAKTETIDPTTTTPDQRISTLEPSDYISFQDDKLPDQSIGGHIELTDLTKL